MRIGICGPFNPYSIQQYLDSNQIIPHKSQTATAVNTYVNELLSMGHHVVIFSTTGGKSCHLKGKNVDIYLITNKPSILSRGHIFGFIYMPKRIARTIKEHLEDIDVLHAQWTYEPALAASRFADLIPVFCTVRDWCPYIFSLQRTFRKKIRWFVKLFIFRRLMKQKNVHFVANSHYTFSKIKDNYPEKTVDIIPNSIDKNLIINKDELSKQKHHFISIATSLAEPRKNIITLLKAFSVYKDHHQDAILYLIGNHEIIAKKWERQGLLNGVVLLGKLPHDEVIKCIDKAFCLVHPSYEETFGNILLEAMARCIPCIGGFNSGAVPSVLGDGKYGILCDISDYKAIYRSMESVNNEIITNSIIHNAREMLLSTYSSNTIAEKHLVMYKRTL